MESGGIGEEEVYGFIADEIETVPHLEALLLLWSSRPERWPEEKLAARLFVPNNTARSIMQDLVRRRLISGASNAENEYWYEPDPDGKDPLIAALADVYRRQLVRVSTIIHSKAPSAVRDFARAFKFTKDRE